MKRIFDRQKSSRPQKSWSLANSGTHLSWSQQAALAKTCVHIGANSRVQYSISAENFLGKFLPSNLVLPETTLI
jgi:nitrate/nitrite transporter NarK